MSIGGLGRITDTSHRRTAESAVRDGLADYRPEYRAPNVEFTAGGGVQTMSANYEQTGVRIGTDKIQIHPNYVEYRADRMAHMVRHENAHRAVEVLKSKVEARDGREAALAWRQRVDRAAVDWMTSALDEAPSDPRLEYGRLHRKFAEQQTRGHGSPPDEAFADLVGYLAAGESMPGDTSPVLALIREAEPGGIFTGDLTPDVSGPTMGRGGTDGGVPERGAQDRRLPVPSSSLPRPGGRRPGGTPLDTSRVPMKDGGMTETTTAGPVPKATGYVKGREIRPGMVINAGDLLPMHERQGQTTGENPNPRGHQEWVRVGMIGNSNTPGFKDQYGGSTLTGGMYIVVDQSGRPVGRMSANTIAETTDLPAVHEARINQVRMPIKVKDKRTGEIRDSFTVAGVPSKHAQEELGLPAPRFLREGVLDPADPNYGKEGTFPRGTRRPFGGRVEGTRTREESAADRTRRRDVYAAGEEERAKRLEAEKREKKAQDVAEQARQREESDQRIAQDREQRRRKWLQDQHRTMAETIAAGGREEFDWQRNESTLNRDVDGILRKEIGRFGEGGVNNLARAYGVKWRGKTRDEKIASVLAAVKAGKTPDEEIDAPKVKAPIDEAAKATAAAKRRQGAIAKNFDEIKGFLDAGNESDASFHLRVMMSDNAVTQLAEAFGLEELSGDPLKAALFEAIRAGRTPDGGPGKGAGEPTTAAPVPNGSGGMVRPIVASGRFRDMRAKNFSDPPTGAAELHQRMQGDTPWTEEQVKAYRIYSLDDYRRINDVARGRREPDSVTVQQSAAMRAGMRPIPDNIIAYRTVHPEAFGFPGTHDKLTDAELQGLVGRIFHDPAPTSTSLNSRMNRALQLRIKVPAGTRGAYIADVSSAKTEYELLLHFGTHYKIEGFTRTPSGDTVLNLTVVGQDE